MSRIFFKKDEKKSSLFITLAFLLVMLTAIGAVLAGPVHTSNLLSLLPFDTGAFRAELITLTRLAVAGAAILLLVGIVHVLASRSSRFGWRGLLSMVAVPGLAALFFLYGPPLPPAPYLHELTTDLATPPRFHIIPERVYDPLLARDVAGSPLMDNYAARHDTYFADLTTAYFDQIPAILRPRILLTVRSLGWTLVSEGADTGPVEAYTVTPWFGDRSNFAIRIRENGDGSLLDIRAVSSETGTEAVRNVERIRKFLATLRNSATGAESSGPENNR